MNYQFQTSETQLSRQEYLLSTNYQDWHIAKHNIYGNLFREKFLSSAIDIPNRNIISDDIVTDDIDVFELVDD